MHTKIRKSQWVLALSAALLIALLAATTVFAEGEQPPEAPTAEETAAQAPADGQPAEAAPAAPEETAAEEPPAPEPAPEAEAAPAAEEAAVVPPPTEEAAQEPAPEAETASAPEETASEVPPVEESEPAPADEVAQEPLAEVASEAAENGVEIVDEDGGDLPLTEANTAELLGGGDPYYKVGLIQYNFYADPSICGGAPYCWDDKGPGVIQFALNTMADTGLPSDRKLYVLGGGYNGFTINGSSDPWLTLLGGVIGVDGSENTFINSDITVVDTDGGFTLSGFTLNTGGGIYFGENYGALKIADVEVRNYGGDYALEVYDQGGAVTLEGVNVSDNSQNGAFISAIGRYPITIKNSAFNHNGYPDSSDENSGLEVQSYGAITIDGVSASGNNGDGINPWEYGTLNLKNAFMSGNSSDEDDYGYALYGQTGGSGSATLENVYAYGNDYGISLWGGSLNAKYIEVGDSVDGYGLYFYSTVGSSKVEYSQFHNNDMDGLHIENKGTITLNSVECNDNVNGSGAYLDNYHGTYSEFLGSGAVTITSPASGGWQLGNGFSNNGDSGVTIWSRGNVLISNVDMNDNDSIGLCVDNTNGIGSVTLNTTLTNWDNGFHNNDNQGISINSQGAVKLSKTQTEWNGMVGIEIYTRGTIDLTNVYSANNNGYGAYLDNQAAPLPRNVTLTNCSFDHNNNYGLEVYSNGSITAYGLSASGNSIRSLDMGSYSNTVSYHDLLGEDWIVDEYTFTGTAGQPVDLYLESDDFDAYLELYSPSGGFYVSDDNGWYDTNSRISLANLTWTGEYTVVVKSYENNGSGEYWFALNDPTHTNPSGPSYNGADLDNTAGNGAVSIYKPKDLNWVWGNFFDRNTGNGIRIASNGTILLDSAAAQDNFYTGAYLNNPDSSASVTVSNSRTDGFYSEFSRNGTTGLDISTSGNVTLKNIAAWDNGSSGVMVDNCQLVSGVCQGFGGVKVLALGDRSNDFGENGSYGLSIHSKGAILLTNIYAAYNTYDGVYIYNADDGSTGSVILAASPYGWNNFTNNEGYGLGVTSNGSISLSKLDANKNAYDGVNINNKDGDPATSAGIVITRAYVYDNIQYGLEAFSEGAIVWKFGDARRNQYAGAMLDNTDGSAGISVLGSSGERMEFTDNGDYSEGNGGLHVFSKGKIILGYAYADNNNGHGLWLDNDSSTTNQMVDVTEAEARRNTWSGLQVESLGAINVKGVNCEDNGNHGAYLDNDGSGAIGAVTVTTSPAWTWNALGSNRYSGLTIESRGSVSLKNVDAWNNGWDGSAYYDWDGICVDNTSGSGTVTFITTGRQYWLDNNGGSGLVIDSNGSVILTNQYGLNAHNNLGTAGVHIVNNGTLPGSTVSLTRVFANENNGGYGLQIGAKGNVTAVSLTAQNNLYDGAMITSSTGSVMLSGSNLFTDNGGDGLDVTGMGVISILNARAWHNDNEGISAISTYGGNITLNTVIAAHNLSSGIYLETDGNFYLNKATAFANGQADNGGLYDDGLGIDAGYFSTITILNSTFMTNWNGSGIDIKHPLAVEPRTLTSFWPTLINTSYLSNNETNLWVHP